MGRLQGSLKDFSGADLGGVAIRGALDKAGVAPQDVQYVIMGQVLTAGAGPNPAPPAAPAPRPPPTPPPPPINKSCLSRPPAPAPPPPPHPPRGVDVRVGRRPEAP